MYNFRCYVQMYSYGRPCSVTFFRLNIACGENCFRAWLFDGIGQRAAVQRERESWVCGSTVNCLALSLNLEL